MFRSFQFPSPPADSYFFKKMFSYVHRSCVLKEIDTKYIKYTEYILIVLKSNDFENEVRRL